MSDSSTTWFITYTKLRFFTRIRRLLHPKTSNNKPYQPSDQNNTPRLQTIAKEPNPEEEGTMESESEDDFAVLQTSVKKLHFGSWEEKEAAARDIKRLAGGDLKRRKIMGGLGVVPPLVEMVGSEVARRRKVAVQALIELSNGTFTNKALMVEAGILSRLPESIDDLEELTRHDFAELLLSISSLVHSQFPFASSEVLPFLVCILDSNSSIDTKELCLCTLYNLSTMLENAGTLATNEVVKILLRLSSVTETSEKALAIFGNLAVTLIGKKALENNTMVPESFIEILTWEEKPKCQELSAYILMVLAHHSSVQRAKMSKAGIVPVLLEVALLSSPLAQKRALKLLQWFKDERQMRIGPHSGPQTGRIAIGSPVNQKDVNEGEKMMKKIVKQSLYKNMETITRRANGAEVSSKLKALIISSSSKSLPY
ncbi:unnamed protein product [Ilex paraguariensis]|uniref:U-box domain-containing protein 7 n=1 Tax=Ilex paraguariensis TaxID=185542 RepID=A0ABC8RYU6_9AQUA